MSLKMMPFASFSSEMLCLSELQNTLIIRKRIFSVSYSLSLVLSTSNLHISRVPPHFSTTFRTSKQSSLTFSHFYGIIKYRLFMRCACMTIEDYRVQFGWSKRRMAKEAGIDTNTLKSAIDGNPVYRATVGKIAHAINQELERRSQPTIKYTDL